jgi:hypothetical protein
MDFKDIKKLSCADLNWLKNIENCGKLEVPVYVKSNSVNVSMGEIMRVHNSSVYGRNTFNETGLHYVVTSRVTIPMKLSACNSIIISSEHWGNWN